MLLQTAKEEEREATATQKADDCCAKPVVMTEVAAKQSAGDRNVIAVRLLN
jgi:hypothetical protein